MQKTLKALNPKQIEKIKSRWPLLLQGVLKHGMTHKDISTAFKRTSSSVSRWISGDAKIPKSKIEEYLKIYNHTYLTHNPITISDLILEDQSFKEMLEKRFINFRQDYIRQNIHYLLEIHDHDVADFAKTLDMTDKLDVVQGWLGGTCEPDLNIIAEKYKLTKQQLTLQFPQFKGSLETPSSSSLNFRPANDDIEATDYISKWLCSSPWYMINVWANKGTIRESGPVVKTTIVTFSKDPKSDYIIARRPGDTTYLIGYVFLHKKANILHIIWHDNNLTGEYNFSSFHVKFFDDGPLHGHHMATPTLHDIDEGEYILVSRRTILMKSRPHALQNKSKEPFSNLDRKLQEYGISEAEKREQISQFLSAPLENSDHPHVMRTFPSFPTEEK
ncbi:hypothetical protein [Terasakiella sp. SH-1]|uniref:hypothetical protein n=1 Tax=Terasakiella sp. SH-1 TaxID=2560057 RepID=UPI001073AB63|nr:hypothetical protein [Terasakiella sp. SH-1]